MRLHRLHQALAGAAILALPALPAVAGSFLPLPTSGSNILITTLANEANDPIYLGFGIPAGYTQEFFSARPILRVEDGEDEAEEVGTFYDIVLRNASTGHLAFGSRVVIVGEEEDDDDGGGIAVLEEEGEEDEIELNHVQRLGFAGYTTQAGWYRETDDDLRPFAVGMTSSFYPDGPLDGSFYDPNAATFRTDINPEEGQPSSGWYLVHTNATAYRILGDAAIVYGPPDEDEGRPFATQFVFDATAPVPEPSEYALMGAGLLVMAAVMRRRKVRGEA
jgi:hypothetical protein